jgi:hypothetical protein
MKPLIFLFLTALTVGPIQPQKPIEAQVPDLPPAAICTPPPPAEPYECF